MCVLFYKKNRKGEQSCCLKKVQINTHTHTHNEEITVFRIVNKCKTLTDLCYKEVYVKNS